MATRGLASDAFGCTGPGQRTFGAIFVRSGEDGILPLSLSYNGTPYTFDEGEVVSISPNIAGGASPYGYAVQSGSLPSGLSLDANTGVISGTCSTAGAFTATIRVTDDNSDTSDAVVEITVEEVASEADAGLFTAAGYWTNDF